MSRLMSIERVNEYGQNAVRIAIEDSAVLLEAADLDAVIEHLGVLRATMRPEVPKEPLRTHQYVIEIDPCWHTEKHPLHDPPILHSPHYRGYFHPGLFPSSVFPRSCFSCHLTLDD